MPIDSKAIDLDLQGIGVGKFLFLATALCMECQNKWIEKVTTGETLFELLCPVCGKQNSFAAIIPPQYQGEFGEKKSRTGR